MTQIESENKKKCLTGNLFQNSSVIRLSNSLPRRGKVENSYFTMRIKTIWRNHNLSMAKAEERETAYHSLPICGKFKFYLSFSVTPSIKKPKKSNLRVLRN